MLLGFTWRTQLPRLGDLRNPVSIVSGSKAPDGHDGWQWTLTKRFDSWASLELSGGKLVDNESGSTLSEVTHKFVIRQNVDKSTPEEGEYIVHDGRIYRVLDARAVASRALYWIVATNDDGPLSSYIYDNASTPENPHDPENPEPEPEADNPDFPFWGG